MHDQLAGWIGDIIEGVALLVSLFLLQNGCRNRHKRVRRFWHWKIGAIEITHLDDVDDA